MSEFGNGGARLRWDALASGRPDRSAEPGARVSAAELYSRYNRLIKYLLKVYGIPAEYREDLLSQIYIKITGGLRRMRYSKNVKGWVCIIARNEIFAFFNRHKKERRILSSFSSDSVDKIASFSANCFSLFPVEHRFYLGQLRRILAGCLERLDRRSREALELRYFRRLKWDEVAEVLGIGKDAARKRAEKARDKLLRLVRRTVKTLYLKQ